MLFAFLISLLGFSIVIRTAHVLIARRLFEQRELTKIGTGYLFSVIALFRLLPHSRICVWAAIFVPLFALMILLFSLVKRRSRAFRRALFEVLTLISLKMKAGRSFRQSLAEVTNESDAKLRTKLSEIASDVVFSQQTSDDVDPFVAEVIEELIQIDKSPHAATRRLGVFRDKLRIEDDFRRRSGQVLARTRAQSLVMSGLYLAILIFMSCKFGFRANLNAIGLSILLFMFGALWIWLGGRSLRWKV